MEDSQKVRPKSALATTFGEGEVFRLVHHRGVCDLVLRVGFDRPLLRQPFRTSARERVVGMPAERSDKSLTAYAVLDEGMRYTVRVVDDRGAEVTSIPGEGIPSSLCLSPRGERLAVVVFGGRRASMGRTPVASAR